MIRIISLFTLISLLAFSCKKEDDHIDFSGSISISSPTVNDTVFGGNSFLVTGSVTGNTEMHGYQITIYNQTDQSVVYTNIQENHADSYAINETITHSLSVGTPLRLVIDVEVDHDGESMSKEVLFYYQP